jgi:hypothetical protein
MKEDDLGREPSPTTAFVVGLIVGVALTLVACWFLSELT